jgi:hypothetical protein
MPATEFRCELSRTRPAVMINIGNRQPLGLIRQRPPVEHDEHRRVE